VAAAAFFPLRLIFTYFSKESHMADGRYEVLANDILACGWENALVGVDQGFHGAWQALHKASQLAVQEARAVQGRALRLLADATSMMFNPKNLNTPFGAVWEAGQHRSALPGDFLPGDLVAMYEASKTIDNPFIKSRLADVVWIAQVPRNLDAARIAADAYLAIPLEHSSWASTNAVDAWMRAVVLLRQLGKGEVDRLKQFEAALLQKAREAVPDGGFFLKKMSSVLLAGDLGRDSSGEIGTLLEAYAQRVRESGDERQVRIYLEAAAHWFGLAKNDEQKFDCLCAAAETYVAEADMRIAGANPSHMVAASFYEDAIQAFRIIPNIQREKRGLGKRIDEIHDKLKVSGEASLKEMVTISSDAIDLSEVAEASKAFVRGKKLWDAVHALTNVFEAADIKTRRERAEKSFRDSPIQAMVDQTHMSPDGRVVAIRSGISLRDANAPENAIALQAEMVKGYAFDITVGIRAQIYPALEAVRLEHRISLEDIVELTRQSPIVPPRRHRLIAKAIFYGFDGDHEAALHFAIPQIEHLVRWQLNRIGVKTTTLNKQGVETENGLSTIAALAELDSVFGEELAFEIRSLFCDPFGPNLRNEMAHGLLDSSDCASEHSVYAWWFLLRLVLSQVVAAQIRQNALSAKA
jgi:hypothetical protein